jgi:hypothetical protein
MLAALLLIASCAPTTDEQVRLIGVGTARAAPDPKPVPRFTETSFIAADGQILPLRNGCRKPRQGRAKAVIPLCTASTTTPTPSRTGEIWAKEGSRPMPMTSGFGAAPERGFCQDALCWRPTPRLPRKYCAAVSPRTGLSARRAWWGSGGVALTGESDPNPADGVAYACGLGRRLADLLPRLALWAGVRLCRADSDDRGLRSNRRTTSRCCGRWPRPAGSMRPE